MSRSRHAKPGSNHNTRDLVGRGADWQPKTSYYKRFLRRKARAHFHDCLQWIRNNCYSTKFIIWRSEDIET